MFFAPGSIFAQVEQQEDLHAYFDDGNLSKRKNILATDFIAPLSGGLALRYERALGKSMSVEIGATKLLPFYLFELPPVELHTDPKGGWGLSFATHFFFDDRSPERHFVGPRYAWRRYTFDGGRTTTVHDITWNYGYNFFLGKYLMFCLQYGIGYRREVNSFRLGLSGGYSRGTFSMPYIIGIGFMF
jgi:hypothetical protein